MLKTIFSFVVWGMTLGITAGISPGPLLTLAISETIQHGKKAGILVALIPFIFDGPLVVAALWLQVSLVYFNTLIGYIALTGGFFLLYMSYKSFHSTDIEIQQVYSKNLKKDVPNNIHQHHYLFFWLTNLLNPHPYIFWFTLGAPIVLHAYAVNLATAISFIFSFYLSLCGSKIILVILLDKWRNVFHSRTYTIAMRSLAIILFVFALSFLHEGVRVLGIL